tara:strand:+ start:2807 stop:3544 length:738 start_codon:yes stop_codon:yes gene_type:complete
MAISSSGAVSFANIQTEYGGSNPISLSEYYSGGSLVKANTSSTSNSSTIAGATATVGSGKSSYYIYFRGWAHSSLFASGQPFSSFSSPGTQTESGSIAKVSGADLTGNAGNIPSSGLISMNHFRGTNTGTDNTFTCYGIATTKTGSVYISNLWIILSGHYGNVTYTGSDVTFTNVPYTNVSVPANGSFAASTANTSGTGASGDIAFRSSQTQGTNSTIGNYTYFLYRISSDLFSTSGSLNVTFNF